MSKRKTTVSNSSRENGYKVGYCRPPKDSRFQPGQSGNPRGRRKGLRNSSTDVKEHRWEHPSR